jgi:hypothetical protein
MGILKAVLEVCRVYLFLKLYSYILYNAEQVS